MSEAPGAGRSNYGARELTILGRLGAGSRRVTRWPAAALGCALSLAMSCNSEPRAAPSESRSSLSVPGAQAGSAPPASASAPQIVAKGAIDPEATQFDYPFPVRFFEFESQRQKLRMAYLDVSSEKPDGRVVVLLHGKNFAANYWERTIRALSEAGFRVIAPDQIGFGKSSKPASYQYSFAALAGNTRALLTSLQVERSAIVGHSMGGMLASRYALSFPDATTKLVLVNPIGLEDYGALVPYRSVDDWYRRELKQTAASIREYQKQAYYAGSWRPEYEDSIRLASGWTLHPDYSRVAWSAALTSDMILTQPVVHDLPRLRVPTLLMIGLRDRTALGRDFAPPAVAATMGDYPRLAQRTQRAIPGAKLHLFHGVGHLPQVEVFDEYRSALLEFLVPAQPAAPDGGGAG